MSMHTSIPRLLGAAVVALALLTGCAAQVTGTANPGGPSTGPAGGTETTLPSPAAPSGSAPRVTPADAEAIVITTWAPVEDFTPTPITISGDGTIRRPIHGGMGQETLAISPESVQSLIDQAYAEGFFASPEGSVVEDAATLTIELNVGGRTAEVLVYSPRDTDGSLNAKVQEFTERIRTLRDLTVVTPAKRQYPESVIVEVDEPWHEDQRAGKAWPLSTPLDRLLSEPRSCVELKGTQVEELIDALSAEPNEAFSLMVATGDRALPRVDVRIRTRMDDPACREYERSEIQSWPAEKRKLATGWQHQQARGALQLGGGVEGAPSVEDLDVQIYSVYAGTVAGKPVLDVRVETNNVGGRPKWVEARIDATSFRVLDTAIGT